MKVGDNLWRRQRRARDASVTRWSFALRVTTGTPQPELQYTTLSWIFAHCVCACVRACACVHVRARAHTCRCVCVCDMTCACIRVTLPRTNTTERQNFRQSYHWGSRPWTRDQLSHTQFPCRSRRASRSGSTRRASAPSCSPSASSSPSRSTSEFSAAHARAGRPRGQHVAIMFICRQVDDPGPFLPLETESILVDHQRGG